MEEDNRIYSSELITAQGIHERLLRRFGDYRNSDWQPSQDNVVVLNNEDFESKWMELGVTDDIDKEESQKYARDVIGFAHFESKKLYVRSTKRDNSEIEQTIAHEMLHLWFLRSELVPNERFSYDVNETFIDTLALEGLGAFEIPKKERTVYMDNAINNTIMIKTIIDKMGEEGWRDVFEVCQNGDEWNVRKLTKAVYGAQPPTKELHKLNEQVPGLYGNFFWDRFKEVALAVYQIRRDANFQNENPGVNFMLYLTSEWAGITTEVEKELGR